MEGGPIAPQGAGACWHLQALGIAPSPTHGEHGGELQLTAGSHLYTDAAMDKRPQPRIAVSEDISGAKRAGSPAPCQAAVHRGPCLPGSATKPPTAQGLYFEQLCSSYSSLSYCMCTIPLLNKALALFASKPLAQAAPRNVLWLSRNHMEKVFF